MAKNSKGYKPAAPQEGVLTEEFLDTPVDFDSLIAAGP
jgi:NADH:ubiquinone oxidoreductase subunit F (NADH-binding)